jgi:hypothetical protein
MFLLAGFGHLNPLTIDQKKCVDLLLNVPDTKEVKESIATDAFRQVARDLYYSLC